MLFEPDRDQNVRGGHRREEQMPDRHGGRDPECDEETQIERVPHRSVQQRYPKGARGGRFSELVTDDLPQSEQVEMVDGERRHEHETEPGERQRVEHDRSGVLSTSQIRCGSGRHCHITSASVAEASRT